MTREEFESILEEAFLAGYNDAIDEIFEEDNTFDLEDEMDSYLESKNVRNQMDKFRHITGNKSAYYNDGRPVDTGMYDDKSINKGLKWGQYTNQGGHRYVVNANYGGKYDEYKSPARGRIKSGNDYDIVNSSRMDKIKKAIERNKELVANRKNREIAKNNIERARSQRSIFANKGNKY